MVPSSGAASVVERQLDLGLLAREGPVGHDRDRPVEKSRERIHGAGRMLAQERSHLGVNAQRDPGRVLLPGSLALHAAERVVRERLRRADVTAAVTLRALAREQLPQALARPLAR